VNRLASKRTAVLLALIGAGLILLAGSRTWATVRLIGSLPGTSQMTVSGRRSDAAAIPIALAVAAGAIVLATAGRVVRVVVGAGLTAGGLVVAVGAARAGHSHEAALSRAVQDVLGVVSRAGGAGFGNDVESAVVFSVWPWVAVTGGLLVVLAGLLTLARGWSWAGPSRRYERAGEPLPAAPGTPAARAPVTPGPVSPGSTWDALSRGEDPTSRVEERT
jgi:uncharacterized membrane protein (TIGR02234 family)